MRLIPRIRSRFLASERGFSMIAVMGVMAASSLFVAAAFAAVNGDLPLTRDSQDRKQAYAAAEAGINYYQYHLNQDSDYWTRCTAVPAPNLIEKQPVNDVWDGVTPTADPRRWRKVAGAPTEYTIELLPANGKAKCLQGDQTTMIDAATGSFKVRATGRPRAGSGLKRSLIAQFRRRSFLDFLYFTEFETTDPAAYDSSWQSWAQMNCGDKPRAQRVRSGGPNGRGCEEIQFADADEIEGPFHTNDDILTCGTTVFGRVGKADSIEFSGPSPGYDELGGSCSGSPTFNGPVRASVKPLNMPPTNKTLEAVALSGGTVYSGETWIRFNSGGDMTVKNDLLGGACRLNQPAGCPQPLPANGVIYVQTPLTGSNCGTTTPASIGGPTYATRDKCGNLYVSGTYTKSMTLAAANDIIVRPWSNSSDNGDLLRSGDAVMGLIAENFVRVYHPCPQVSNLMDEVTIQAAILSIKHSFTVDNHDCGSQLKFLTVSGAIAQKYRGPVGTSGGTGFKKNYEYDDRLRYRSPPYFLEPVAASWHVIRSNEQVPPR